MTRIYLFHGTSSKLAPAIKRNGLLPRNVSGKSVYEGALESAPDLIYLTDVYAVQFALIACKTFGGSPVVFRALVDDDALLPDTDFPKSQPLAHGVCAVAAPSIMPDRLYKLGRFDRDPFDRIPAGIQHRAMKQHYENAQEWVLMNARTESRCAGEWTRND